MSRSDDFDEMLRDLESGLRVADTRFDKIFPVEVRSHGRIHWTPVAVALEAVEWLMAEASGELPFRILDVGSNVGKFCVVGALSSRAHFTGVERRREMVDLARSVTRELRVQRVRYLWKDMADLDWGEFHGVYLYNPFHENIDPEIRVDSVVSFSPELFKKYVSVVQEKLAAAPIGLRVVTYYGFGGEFPAGFEKVEPVEPLSDRLEFWVKRE